MVKQQLSGLKQHYGQSGCADAHAAHMRDMHTELLAPLLLSSLLVNWPCCGPAVLQCTAK